MHKPILITTSHGLYHREKKKRIKNAVPFYISKPQLGVSCKIRNDYADYDYIEQLDTKSLEFLKAFHREYVNADFKHKYKKLHKSKKTKKICYDANNSRNRDLYARAKSQCKLTTYGLDIDIDLAD